MCRSFVPEYIKNGVEKYTGRYNLGVVSVNVPYAAAEAIGDKEKFFEILDSYCELAYQYHMIRINRFKKTKARQNPILWMTGALANLKPHETVEQTIYDGNATASLGYVGVYEAQEICGDTSKDFAMKIVKFLKGKCEEWKEKTRITFSLYGTPKLLGL
jgi:ribonucleoside-triphosphate reductase